MTAHASAPYSNGWAALTNVDAVGYATAVTSLRSQETDELGFFAAMHTIALAANPLVGRVVDQGGAN